LLAGVQYAEGRKAVEFEATDSASSKALYVYRLLVHDKVISPMPEEQVGEKRSATGLQPGMHINCPRDIRCWNEGNTGFASVIGPPAYNRFAPCPTPPRGRFPGGPVELVHHGRSNLRASHAIRASDAVTHRSSARAPHATGELPTPISRTCVRASKTPRFRGARHYRRASARGSANMQLRSTTTSPPTPAGIPNRYRGGSGRRSLGQQVPFARISCANPV